MLFGPRIFRRASSPDESPARRATDRGPLGGDMPNLTRRRLLRQLSWAPAVGLVAAMPRPARAAAEFPLKYANNLPMSHPLNIRAAEAAARVLKESNGRVEISIFPNN